MKTELMLGTKEAARVLGITRMTLWHWQKKGWVSKPKQIGPRRLFDMEKLIAEAQRNKLTFDPLALEVLKHA